MISKGSQPCNPKKEHNALSLLSHSKQRLRILCSYAWRENTVNCFRMESYKIKFKAALLDMEKTLALAAQSGFEHFMFNPLTRQQVERGSPRP